MLSVIMLRVAFYIVTLSAIMLSVVLLSVMAPKDQLGPVVPDLTTTNGSWTVL